MVRLSGAKSHRSDGLEGGIAQEEVVPRAGIEHALESIEFFSAPPRQRLSDTNADTNTRMVALHDLNAAMRFADRVMVSRDGHCRAAGPPQEILTVDLLAEVYGVRAEIARTNSGGMAIIPREALERP